MIELYTNISYTKSNRIATVSLNRPEKRNALNHDLVSELTSLFQILDKDPETKVIILKGEGEVFCAGADLAYLQQLQKNTYEENLEDSNHLRKLFSTIYNLSKVVIAQIHGAAIAGGCGLATVSDVVFCSEETKFGFTEVNIGFIPAIVSIFTLRKLGESKARELLLSGRIIGAEEAADCGISNFVVNIENLSHEVNLYAQRLVNKTSANSLTLTKQLIASVQDQSLENALQYTAELNARARASEDCKRGISAFLNKEKIDW